MKIHWDFQSVFTFMVDAFPSCKDVHSAMGQTYMDTIIEISVAHGQPPIFSASNCIFAHFFDWLFHTLKTLAKHSPKVFPKSKHT